MRIPISSIVQSMKWRLLPPLSFALPSHSQYPKVFWGVKTTGPGGPATRTEHISQSIGDYKYGANLIYAQSWWPAFSLRLARRAARRKWPLVFNQDGHYYPGWYVGNWREANAEITRTQELCRHVLFQSDYCRRTQLELTGFLPDSCEVLHNAVPPFSIATTTLGKKPGRLRCWLSGVFRFDSDHILEPPMEAWHILKSTLGSDCPKLVVAGAFAEDAQQAPWYSKLQKSMHHLKSEDLLVWHGPYKPSDLPSIMRNISFALHLKHQDPCPNAILERMTLGIPHIYSDSGGTPELVSTSGIALPVERSWDERKRVNPEDIAKAVTLMLNQVDELSREAHQLVKSKFNWENYVERHRDIFHSVLNGERLHT